MLYIVRELEQMRRKVAAMEWISAALLLELFGYYLFGRLGAISFSKAGIIVQAVAVLLLLATASYGKIMRDRYNFYYKRRLVRHVLEQTFTEVEYQPYGGVSDYTLLQAEILKIGNKFRVEDHVAGRYKGVHFEQSDLWITTETRTNKRGLWVVEDPTDDGGRKRVQRHFCGRWYVLEFNRSFQWDIQVRQRCREFEGRQVLYRKDYLEPYQMENEQFNRMFRVYAANQQEAFRVITPHFQQTILDIAARVGNGKLVLSFMGDRLHVGVYTNEEAFRLPVFQKLDPYQSMMDIQKDAKLIMDLIDEFQLHRYAASQ